MTKLTDALEDFDLASRVAVVRAQQLAVHYGHPCTDSEHILMSLTHDDTSVAGRALADLGITTDTFSVLMIPSGTDSPQPLPFGEAARQIIEGLAKREATKYGDTIVTPDYLLHAMTYLPESQAYQVMAYCGASPMQVRNAISQARVAMSARH